MIARISSGSNLYGALLYNQDKVCKGQGKVLAVNLVTEPFDSNFNVMQCMNEFQYCMPLQCRTKNIVFHASLNPHPEDKLSDEELAKIGREYMEKLGYKEQPYMIFKHEDIEREHIHIVSLRVKSNGRKLNDSKEYLRSKRITEELEDKYKLGKGKGNTKAENWRLSPINTSKGNIKKQIAQVTKAVVGMYHFQSMGEFRAILSLYNIHTTEHLGEHKGKPYKGITYQAMNYMGVQVGTPIKSSIIGRAVGYSAIERRIIKSKELIKSKKLKAHTLKAVTTAKSKTKTESEFQMLLTKDNIDVIFRRNDEDRIYGITFIDHQSRCVLNGSRLGKEFSANTFNELFKQDALISQDKGDSVVIPSEQNHKSQYTAGVLSILPDVEEDPKAEKAFKVNKRKKGRRFGRQD